MTAMIQQIRLRPRFFACAAFGVAIALFAPFVAPWTTRLLVAWDISAALYLVLVLHMMSHSTIREMRHHAEIEDEGRIAILFLTIVAALASLAAIVVELAGARAESETRTLRLFLVAVTIIVSWLFVHLIFALHYARDYYIGEDAAQGAKKERGGLIFPDHSAPDYWDFLYFSYVIGTSAQTADVSISSSTMRRIVLMHCIIAFAFNTLILALTVNIAAGLL